MGDVIFIAWYFLLLLFHIKSTQSTKDRGWLFLLRSHTETQIFVNELSTECDSSSKKAALMSRHMKIVGTPQTPNSSKLKHDFILVWKCGKVLVLCAAWKHIAVAIVFTTDFLMETAWVHLAAVLPLKLVFAVVIHHWILMYWVQISGETSSGLFIVSFKC